MLKMAGVKISKLLSYRTECEQGELSDDIQDMIIPVSFGNKTLSISIGELFTLMNNEVSERIINTGIDAKNYTDEMINELAESVYNKIIQQTNNEAIIHQQILEEQQLVDDAQNSVAEEHEEKIKGLEDFISDPWEIYNGE